MHALASKPNSLAPTPVSVSSSSKHHHTTHTTRTTRTAHATQAPKHNHIWLVTGPAGCGKSTVAQHLASTLDVPYIEGDEFHPKSNIEKMSNNIPLTDADRWDWLTILREESLRQLASGSSGVVLTCSALKRKYRDVIRVAPYYDPNLLVHFIYLHASEEVLIERVRSRQNHYMGSTMVHSQFDILEPPAADEIDVITVDSTKTPDEVKNDALSKVLDVIVGNE